MLDLERVWGMERKRSGGPFQVRGFMLSLCTLEFSTLGIRVDKRSVARFNQL